LNKQHTICQINNTVGIRVLLALRVGQTSEIINASEQDE
jgi:hypothetical protein